MMKLIKLEWMKNNIGKYVIKAVLLAVIIGSFVLALAFLGIADDPDGTLDAAPGAAGISMTVEMFFNMAYLMLTGSMFGTFIINSYKNRTMELMFSYPIRRQKILASQMIAVWSFNFAALVFTKLLICLCVFMGAKVMPSSFIIDVHPGSVSFYVQLILTSAVIVSMSFIALFAGLVMKSSKAAVVTSFLLIFLTQANVGDFTLRENVVFPAVLTAVSLAFAALSICGAEKKDLV